jgi:predicted transposase/invertase (TIGR01784 family)
MCDNYIHRVKLIDAETNAVVSEKLNFYFVNLPKFCKREDELRSPLDYWLYTLIHSQPYYKIDEAVLRGNSFFAELLDEIKLNKLNEKDMKSYQESESKYAGFRVYISGSIRESREEGIQRGLQRGIKQGIQQGRQEGIQQGLQQGIQQIALNALKSGYSPEDISTLTGMSLKQVNELASQLL